MPKPCWLQQCEFSPKRVTHCASQGQQQLSVVSADQQPLVETQQLPPKAGALSDGDVQRVLAHQRVYLKQQRAFYRACIGSDDAFDPTQVPAFVNCIFKVPAGSS